MLKNIAICALLISLVTPVFASNKLSFYGGFTASVTKVDTLSDNKTSYNGFPNYQFNDNFALESTYRTLGSAINNRINIRAHKTAISLVTSMPIAKDFSVFGLLGYSKS